MTQVTNSPGRRPIVTLPFPRTAKYGQAEQDAVLRLMETGRLSETGRGPATSALETAFATLVGVEHALAFNSGTAALHAALHAVGAHDSAGVLTSPLTWISAINATFHAGSFPIFSDLAAGTLALDPNAVAHSATTDSNSAVLVTHAYGIPAPMDRILSAADRIPVVEDCSHAHGAGYRSRPVGSWGTAGCFSLQDSKAVSGGEGGILTTSEPRVYERAMTLGHHPHRLTAELTEHPLLGLIETGASYKFRIHPLAAVIAHAQLANLGRHMSAAEGNLTILAQALHQHDAPIALPDLTDGCVRGWYGTPLTVTLPVPDPEALATACTAARIPLRPLYPDWLKSPLLQNFDYLTHFWPHLKHTPYTKPVPEKYPNYYWARRQTLVLKIPTIHVPDYMEQVASALACVLAATLR